MAVNYQSILRRAVERAKAPGAVLYAGTLDETLFCGAVGNRQSTPRALPAEKDTRYDLASLTKVIVTATSIMMLRDEGKLDLDQPVSEIVPIPEFRAFTLRHLLTHTSGLPAFKLWYREVSSVDDALLRIAGLELSWTPGTRRRYSDLGFVILGKVVELAARDSLDAFARKRIFEPLGMSETTFNPSRKQKRHCAATERCVWRERVMVGEVHDENAFAMGGVSGHAGLFAPAEDLAAFCRGLLSGNVLPTATLDEMIRPGQVPHYPWQGLGWKRDPWMGGSEGFLPARNAIGHTGWTGTSIWMDRDRGFFVILLSNTCHPSRRRKDSRTLRRIVHLGTTAPHYPRTTNAHTGLDRLMWMNYEPLLGKRIGLLTNHAAVDTLGRSIFDVLHQQPEVMLTRLFSPEHGLRAQKEAGEHVDSQSGKVPITSLYGKRKRPTASELAEIEVFVVDLPDVGARYYTYMATMKECLAACAEAQKPVLVLDRPNPLGGAILEGPIARTHGSIVCCAPIPIRHGMTLGELALFFQKTELHDKKLNLQLLAVDNWPRERYHQDCALPWVPPSPNIPDPDTALLYVGMCLFEGINMNEGRGTEAPFRLIGAPWLHAKDIVDALAPEEYPGLSMHTTLYVPHSIPGKASKPRYQDQLCRGIRIVVEDRTKVRAFTTAVALLRAIAQRHQKELEWKTFFDTLAGGTWLREQIQSGVPALELVQGLTAEHEQFDRLRPKRYNTLNGMLKNDGLPPA